MATDDETDNKITDISEIEGRYLYQQRYLAEKKRQQQRYLEEEKLKLLRAVDDISSRALLSQNKDILNFARWVSENVVEEVHFPGHEEPKRDLIREILMTMPDKNGYYSPPYS